MRFCSSISGKGNEMFSICFLFIDAKTAPSFPLFPVVYKLMRKKDSLYLLNWMP